jgi:S1-C subfamily serine protease
MKARIAIIAVLLAGGFYYLTSGPGRDSEIFSKKSGPKNGFSPAAFTTPSVAQSAGLSSDELNNIEIYRRANGATVNITSTTYRRDWFAIYPQRNTGSGFFVDDKGHILTNFHVVENALQGAELLVTVPESKRKLKAQLLERDPANDLALIKVSGLTKIAHLKLGESDNLQVGQKVLAIGNPFGLFDGSLTTGIISSLGRTIQDETQRELEGLIQTDAAINPGNSGGPLLDSQGNVIGINTAIYGPGGNIGIGFAMPISRAKAMLEAYQSGRPYVPPRLGVSVLYVEGDWARALDLPEEGGLLVQGVQEGSAAEKAGIRGPREARVLGGYKIGVGGDLIQEVDGRPCDRPDAISRILARRRAGDQVEIKLIRGGREMKLRVTLGGAKEERL